MRRGDSLSYDFARQKEDVAPSYREWNPPRAIDIFRYLPKTDCKKCGLSTCMAFAIGLVLEKVNLEDCIELAAGSESYQQIKNMIE